MANKLRVGILGAGWAAREHAAAFGRLPEVEVCALWNRTRARAEELAGQIEGAVPQVYANWQDLIEHGAVDIVSVATTEHLRLEPVLAALEHGIHVLVEKPLSIALDDAQAMAAAARHADVVAAMGLTWRYSPGVQTAWQGLREDWIGTPFDIQLIWRFGLSPRQFKEWLPWISEEASALGGGGSHEFDKARFLTGSEFLGLTGRVQPLTFPSEPDFTSYGTYALVADMTRDILATFRLTNTAGQSDWTATFNGEGGTLIVTNTSVHRQRPGEPEPTRMPIPDAVQVPQGADVLTFAWSRLIADFVSAIRAGDKDHRTVPHLPTLDDGLRTQEVVAAAKLAEAERRWVTISEVA